MGFENLSFFADYAWHNSRILFWWLWEITQSVENNLCTLTDMNVKRWGLSRISFCLGFLFLFYSCVSGWITAPSVHLGDIHVQQWDGFVLEWIKKSNDEGEDFYRACNIWKGIFPTSLTLKLSGIWGTHCLRKVKNMLFSVWHTVEKVHSWEGFGFLVNPCQALWVAGSPYLQAENTSRSPNERWQCFYRREATGERALRV